jgi:ubiquinol-cytochrome c reductase cytochrome c subunit
MSAERPRGSRVLRLAVWWLPALAVAAVAGVALPAAHAAPPQPAAASVNGQTAYAEHCAACHGVDGRGTARAPSLAGVGEADVDFQLTTGRMPRRDTGPSAPPYRAQLDPATIAALDQYVTALVAHGGPGIPAVNPTAGDVAHGASVFSTNCAECHSITGVGGELTDRPVPKITEATPTQLGEAVRSGPAQMPRFGTDAVTPQDLNDLAAYAESLKHHDARGGDGLGFIGPVAEGAVAWMLAMVAIIGFIRWIGKRG